MNLSFVVGGAVGYVLGAKAGQERYESIVALGRKVAGSQTVQATAGVLRAQVDSVRGQARQSVASKIRAASVSHGTHQTNGHHH